MINNNVQHLNNHNDSSLLNEQLTNSFDDLNDLSSVQLISVTDEDSENNSEYLTDNCDNKLDCNETQLKDDNESLDGKNIGQKLDGKKKTGKKMDKLIKHIQEALLTPSLNSITVNNNNCTNNNTDTNKMEQKNCKETADQQSEDPHQSSAAISASNTGKLSNISSNNWLNEIKFGNIVNLTKLSKPKPTTDTVADSSVDGRRLSFAAGVKNQLVFSSIDNQSVMVII